MSKNPYIDDVGFIIKDTKKNAKKKCESTPADSQGYGYSLWTNN